MALEQFLLERREWAMGLMSWVLLPDWSVDKRVWGLPVQPVGPHK